MMTPSEITVMLFVLSILVVAVLSIVLSACTYEHIIWKLGLGICMVLTGCGIITSFIPFLQDYSPLFRMWGELLMVSSVAYVRLSKMDSVQLVKVSKYNILLRAGIGVLFAASIAAPFFTFTISQAEVKSNQHSLFGIMYNLLTEVKELRVDMKGEQDRQIRQHAKDSVQRAKIDRVVNTVNGKLDSSLQNDRDVKKALGKSGKVTTRPTFYVAPAPRSVPTGNLSQPSTDRVQPVPNAPVRSRKRGAWPIR